MHSEKPPHYLIMKIFLVIVLAYFLGMTFFMTINKIEPWGIMIGAAVVVFWGFISFFNMRYDIDDDALIARMWPFKHTIKFSDIEEIELRAIPWWAGMGYHILGKHFYINTRYGTGITITKKNGGSLTITPKDSEEFMALLPSGKPKNPR